MTAPEQTRVPEGKGVVHMTTAMAAPKPAAVHGPFVPVMLGLLSVGLWMGWQTSVLLADREALHTAHAGQQQTVDNAGKLRGSLDALAADTQRLAEAGNGNAALLVTELKKRGITINPQAGGTASAAPPPR